MARYCAAFIFLQKTTRSFPLRRICFHALVMKHWYRHSILAKVWMTGENNLMEQIISKRTMMSHMDSKPSCQCGSVECQPKILHSILSYKYSTSELTVDGRDQEEKPCHRSVYSPSGSTGSCYNSPRHSPASSPNPAAAPASYSPSPPSKQ